MNERMPCGKCLYRTSCFYTPMEGVNCSDFRPDPPPPPLKRVILQAFPWDDLLKLIAIGCALGVILGIVLKMTL